MRINTSKSIEGDLTTEKELRLELRGEWKRMPQVTIDGQTASATRPARDLVVIDVPAGQHRLALSAA
jgi:hypothetical protein